MKVPATVSDEEQDAGWGDFQALFAPVLDELEKTRLALLKALYHWRRVEEHYQSYIEWSVIFCRRRQNG